MSEFESSDSLSEREQLLRELIESREANPGFDVEAFLLAHAEFEADLRADLRRLLAARALDPVNWASAATQHESFTFAPSSGSSQRYELKSLLHQGGMGELHLAIDRDLDREVALKRIRGSSFPAEPATCSVDRFLAEARVLGRLEHPNIVPLHELSVDARGAPFFTMKLVRGRTLTEAIEQGIPLRTALEILLRVCDAVSFAHSKGVVHRDLKPSNLMVGEFGEVQVMDWGLAKHVGSRSVERKPEEVNSPKELWEPSSSPGDVSGTLAYMAPEQARGEVDQIDGRTDVFGLGAVLHQVLTGRAPYQGTRKEMWERAKRGVIDDPEMKHTQRTVPPEMKAACLKALAASKVDRYQSVADLARDISAYLLDAPMAAYKDSIFQGVVKSVRRHPALAVIVAAAWIVLILLFLFQRTHGQRLLERQRKEEVAAVAAFRIQSSSLASSATMGMTMDGRSASYAASAERLLGALTSLHIGFGEETDNSSRVRRARELCGRHPGLETELCDAMYEVARQLAEARIAHAAWWAEGRIEDFDGASGGWAQIGRDQSGLVEQWPVLVDFLRSFDEDSWRGEAFDAYLDAFRLQKPAPDEVLAHVCTSAEDWEWLGLVRLRSDLETGVGLEDAIHRSHPCFQESVALDWGRFWPHFYLGYSYSARGKQDREAATLGIQHLSVALGIQPSSAMAWINLGVAWSFLGEQDRRAGLFDAANSEVDRAVSAWREVLRLVPGEALATANIAKVLIDQGAVDEARASLLNALKNHEDSASLWWRLGESQRAVGQHQEAAESLERAVAIHRALEIAWWELLDSLEQVDPEEACLRFESMPNSYRGKSRFRLVRARMLASSGNLRLAESVARSLVGDEPEFLDALLELARILTLDGRVPVALDQYDSILEWLELAPVTSLDQLEQVLGHFRSLDRFRDPPEDSEWADRAARFERDLQELIEERRDEVEDGPDEGR